ncbi:hypothetical protein JCM1840_001281 [Sporobolomyces johnsonii]
MAFDAPSWLLHSSFNASSTSEDGRMNSKASCLQRRPLVALVDITDNTDYAVRNVAEGDLTTEGGKRCAKHYLTSILSSKTYVVCTSAHAVTPPLSPGPSSSASSSSSSSSSSFFASTKSSSSTSTKPPASTAWRDDDWFLASPELPALNFPGFPMPLVADGPTPTAPLSLYRPDPHAGTELSLDGKTYLEVWLALSGPAGVDVPADGRRLAL